MHFVNPCVLRYCPRVNNELHLYRKRGHNSRVVVGTVPSPPLITGDVNPMRPVLMCDNACLANGDGVPLADVGVDLLSIPSSDLTEVGYFFFLEEEHSMFRL